MSIIATGFIAVARDSANQIASVLVCDHWNSEAAVAAGSDVNSSPDSLTAMVCFERHQFAQRLLSGTFHVAGYDRHSSRILHIHLAATRRDCQGADLTRRLVKQALERGHREGYTHAFVECIGPISAHIFVNKLGFEPLIDLSPHYAEFAFQGTRPFAPIVFESAVKDGDSRFLLAFQSLEKLLGASDTSRSETPVARATAVSMHILEKATVTKTEVDDVLTCVSSAFASPLPQDELQRLKAIPDLYARRSEIYSALARHLGADAVRGKSLAEFGALGGMLPCRSVQDYRGFLAEDVHSGLEHGQSYSSLCHVVPCEL